MPFNNGENVGPYRVMEQLGRGGMATVYKAYHANLDRHVALKVLHPAFLEDENFLARFQREARLVAKLEHQNIVPVYDFAEHDGQPYLVMKYIEGETLKSYLNRGRLSVEQIWDVVDAVGAGLAYAHRQGILHRDIKPSNVIVADDGQMYLADFGLARIAEMGESTLSGDMIMGTPQYISPEQAMGVKDLDGRTDIYSFAVILYEMVVGQVPFSADTPFSIIHDHIYSPLPLPKTVNPSVPEEVERVLLKALAKERDDRYQSVPILVKAFKDAWDQSDVDMAEVTMTKPITEVAAAIAPGPQAAPDAQTLPPSQAATRVKAEPISVAEDVPSAEKSKKKKKIWLYALGGIAFICVCILAIGAILDRQDAGRRFPFAGDAGKNLSVEEARDWARSEPDDPYAQLELSLAFLKNKQFEPAYQALRRSLELAGDDVDFHYDAGAEMMESETWVGAAVVFTHALGHTPPDQLDDRIIFEELFGESIYEASVAPELFQAVPKDEILRQDEAMLRLAEIRQTVHHGNLEDAWRMLEDLKALKPGMQEATLLEAEMLMRDRRAPEAMPLLESLANSDLTPEWIQMQAEKYLSEMPKQEK